MGLHLIKGTPPSRQEKINPKSCHLSFQAVSLEEVEAGLIERQIDYVKNVFMEEGIQIGQLFFHDPDNNMIEICNCDELPLVPLTEGILACTMPAALAPPAAPAVPAALHPGHLCASASDSDNEHDHDNDNALLTSVLSDVASEDSSCCCSAPSEASAASTLRSPDSLLPPRPGSSTSTCGRSEASLSCSGVPCHALDECTHELCGLDLEECEGEEAAGCALAARCGGGAGEDDHMVALKDHAAMVGVMSVARAVAQATAAVAAPEPGVLVEA
ncbi:hypothetical protein HYH03_000095 [Edaphochlamys debaryana]|uniref:VOC domain-containing protein n=1 Tax=Edaphochlamys debaryana TaxID=47281 RepID=A0A835YN96_9CHLO|nr:hypothetical protein HYH03_000095 [Edaphochlamys debaryana]|eukprot:KAG2501590.1 hypothetical protein HYH03_000095 [Edaphochlamys debaryana]